VGYQGEQTLSPPLGLNTYPVPSAEMAKGMKVLCLCCLLSSVLLWQGSQVKSGWLEGGPRSVELKMMI
jgi:hypothetical protein